MKCLIFGANGYIGRHLGYYLEKYNHIVFNYDIQETSDLPNYNKIDITDRSSLAALDYDVDCIFWFSGVTGTLDSFAKAELFIDVNEVGLVNLLNLLKDRAIKPRIIFPSTRLVYKGKDQALKEDAEKDPKTVYAVNKLACEQYIKAFSHLFDIPYTIYRICVPYGNTLSADYSYGTLGFFVNKAFRGENITLYGDGSLKRTFTHIGDLCHQIICSCEKTDSLNQILNIGGENLSLNEVALIIARQYGVGVEYVDWPQQALVLESGSTFFDDTAIQAVLGGYTYQLIAEQNWK